MAAVILDGRSLTTESVEKIALGEKVEIGPAMRPLMAKGRRIVDEHLARGPSISGTL